MYKRQYPVSKKVKFLSLEKFEPVVSYKNIGVRPTEVNILKLKKVKINELIHFNQQNLLIPRYSDKDKKSCTIKIDGPGIRLSCDGSMACADRMLVFQGINKNDLQFILFNHVNDRGASAISYASLKSLNQSFISEETKNQRLDPFPNIYMLNYLINNIDDTDIYNKNIKIIDVTLQKMGNGENVFFCMKSSLLKNDSLINGVRVFNWKQ